MRLITKIVLISFTGFLLFGSLLVAAPSPAFALFDNAKKDACTGVQLGDPNATCDTAGAGASVSDLIQKGLNIFALIVGIIALFMILYGGLKFILARGESAGVSSARNTVLFAVVGLAIAALAKVIAVYVLARVSP